MSKTFLKIPSLIELYSRPYDERMIEWRRLGAIDKAANIAALVETCGDKANVNSILEVGSGTGAVLDELSRRMPGKQFTGIEIGDTRSKAVTLPGGAQIHGYDGKTIPYPDRSFDLVYASHVLEHVTDERGFLYELRRVARRAVYVEVPLELHARTSWKAVQAGLDIGHINAYTRESFVLKLATSGLAVAGVRVFSGGLPSLTFAKGGLKGRAIHALRSGMLAMNENLATRVFTYNAGALCVPAAKLDFEDPAIPASQDAARSQSQPVTS